MKQKEYYEDIAKKFFAAMNTGDFDQIKDDMDDDIIFEFPGSQAVEGIRRSIIFMRAVLKKYKFLTFKISDIIIDPDKACVVWTNFGEYLDGTDYNNSGVTFMKFKDDKVSFLSDYFKDTSFLNS